MSSSSIYLVRHFWTFLDAFVEMLSFSLSDKNISSLKSLAQLAAKKQQVIEQLNEEELEYIQRHVRISMIGASTRIENAVLTDAEIDWLDTILSKDSKTTAYEENRETVLDKLSKDKERSLDEVAGSSCHAQYYLLGIRYFIPSN